MVDSSGDSFVVFGILDQGAIRTPIGLERTVDGVPDPCQRVVNGRSHEMERVPVLDRWHGVPELRRNVVVVVSRGWVRKHVPEDFHGPGV